MLYIPIYKTEKVIVAYLERELLIPHTFFWGGGIIWALGAEILMFKKGLSKRKSSHLVITLSQHGTS